MATQNLALQYRPRTFSDICGQNTTRYLLASMLQRFYNGEVDLPASLLFVGARGEGKTTAARIVAASLNCDSRDKYEPCGKCGICKDILSGSGGLVPELDAASHGGVDDIKALKQSLYFQFAGKYRVVVIDEVHGLSRAAFDQLLKTLEEPPENTLFIFATTEVDKLPDTFVSRCFVYYFAKITPADIFNRLKYICNNEGLNIADIILQDIAGSVDGAMRDAVMKLNQLVMVGDISYDRFLELFGVVDKKLFVSFMESLVNKTPYDTIEVVNRYFMTHTNARQFVDGLISYLLDVYKLKCGRESTAQDVIGLQVDYLLKTLFLIWEARKEFVGDVAKHKMYLEVMVMKLMALFGVSQVDMKRPQTIVTADVLSEMLK